MKLNEGFLSSLDQIEQEKGIAKDVVLDAFKEAIGKAYVKSLNGGDDALVRVDSDMEKSEITLYRLFNVVDEVQDDYLEISLTDAKKHKKSIKIGDQYEEEVDIAEFSAKTAKSIKYIFYQRLAEIEKSILFDLYKDKIGEMITGIVEKSDDYSTIVNLGRTSVVLPTKQKIGNETFEEGKPIKLYVMDVVSTTKHGAQIAVSRACEGFLKRVFEEEIHEVYDGTVVIKGIAREAGNRSKVAVYSSDINVDPTGACIGPNGSRIQKVVAQLGNKRDKEKIDIITFSDNPALYIAESLKPVQVLGLSVDANERKALVVVQDENFPLAIGKKGVNVRLASHLTGYSIDVKKESDAKELGLSYLPLAEIQQRDVEDRRSREYEAYLNSIKSTPKEEIKPTIVEKVLETASEIIPEVVQEISPVVEEEKVEEVEASSLPTPEVKKEPEVVEIKKVQTTTTLEDLEKELEEDKKKSTKFSKPRKTYRKPTTDESSAEEISKDDSDSTVDKSKYMQIYTDAELAEMEKEAQEYEDAGKTDDDFEDDIDYDEYDEYYDDDDK